MNFLFRGLSDNFGIINDRLSVISLDELQAIPVTINTNNRIKIEYFISLTLMLCPYLRLYIFFIWKLDEKKISLYKRLQKDENFEININIKY